MQRSTDSWRSWDPEAKELLLQRLRNSLGVNARPWRQMARPKQLPPNDPRHHLPDERGFRCGCVGVDDAWSIWMVMAGRGLGKTLLGSNWLIERALEQPGSEWGIFAPTFRDVRKVCIEGSTGILAQLGYGELDQYRRNELLLVLSNGSKIYGYSADMPERVRGANLWGAWVEELGSWRYPATWYEGLVPALRIGENPRIIVTTTPRATTLIKDIASRKDGSVHITRGSTWENSKNLSAAALAELRRRYEGTRLGRQELEGELLTAVEGALWSLNDIDRTRVKAADVPGLTRVVVAIDPAVTSGEDSDETGIVVVGEHDGHGYVLADLSMRGTPDACMRAAVNAYEQYHADCVVAEVNNGGDYIASLLRTVDPNVPCRVVRASRGKAVRAEPVSALYEQGRVHHVGVFPELEDQMTTWVPLDPDSPDRVDALVWGCTELRGLSAGDWNEAYGVLACERCGRLSAFVPDRLSCPHCGETFAGAGAPDQAWRP
ncbi:DNA-packaging protein [Actinoallomurus vinaceus]|uniref:DNA-packaging protein n=1 Tax=Actinoallomurus vinaceus TaxID=1080074 RepID=A0ABP8UBZ7_9ACTN